MFQCFNSTCLLLNFKNCFLYTFLKSSPIINHIRRSNTGIIIIMRLKLNDSRFAINWQSSLCDWVNSCVAHVATYLRFKASFLNFDPVISNAKKLLLLFYPWRIIDGLIDKFRKYLLATLCKHFVT